MVKGGQFMAMLIVLHVICIVHVYAQTLSRTEYIIMALHVHVRKSTLEIMKSAKVQTLALLCE